MDYKKAAKMNWFEGTPKAPEFGTDTYHGSVPFLNVRNRDAARTEIYEIELRDKESHILADFHLNPEDQVRLALSVLGVGRVTDNVEERAQYRASLIMDDNHATSEEGDLDQIVVRLRAILIARELKAKESAKDLDDAYALYKLAYPKTTLEREGFDSSSMAKFWAANLKTMRKDPTALGSL